MEVKDLHTFFFSRTRLNELNYEKYRLLFKASYQLLFISILFFSTFISIIEQVFNEHILKYSTKSNMYSCVISVHRSILLKL